MTDEVRPEVVVAGATGGLGLRIARELGRRGAAVRAVIRPGTAPERTGPLEAAGATPVPVDLADRAALAHACTGAACVVSALNGLEETILDGQAALLEAAVAAGVPRFIPSDFALDFTKTKPGGNRNLDLRRRFHERLDRAPIRGTSVLNGGFMDMLTGQMPLIQFGWRRVLYWGDADQPLDFTAMDDVAAFTAAVALDGSAPRILRIVGEVVSARGLAEAASEVTGDRFRTMRMGGVGTLGAMIAAARVLAPGRGQVFPVWQGMQYLRDMFSGAGKLEPLDNGRYPELPWTGVREVLARR
jgi:nucleoside-diphosphate-sugar epimerase